MTTKDTYHAPKAEQATIDAHRPSLSERIGPIRFRLIVIVIAFAVLAGVITVGFQMQSTPVSTVRDYLQAVHDKDVDAAMSYVSQRPTGAEAHFLTPEALSNEWTIDSVRIENDTSSDGDIVAAKVSTKAGEDTMYLSTKDTDDGWVIENPFVVVSFASSPYDYAEVNGVVAPARAYAFFPGTYTFYESADDTFDRSREAELLAIDEYDDFGGSTQHARTAPIDWKVTDAAVEKAQDAVELKLDDCAKRFRVERPHACPFGTDGIVADDESLHSPTDLQWTIKEYPRIGLKRQTSPAADSAQTDAVVEIEDPGVVQLRGKGYDSLNKQVEFSIECEIDLDGYTVTVDQRSEISLHPFNTARQHDCQP